MVWLVASPALAAYLAYTHFAGADKTLLMPGELSPGHHQLAESCDSCHLQGFGGGEVLQEACIDCHGETRVKPFDSHPRSKFSDPRNADRLEKINAVECVTCHLEHRPEITQKDGLTQPRDLCFHCHAGIGEDRPSHRDMPFDTCKDSGCHNFHDNRALYTDFLVRHMDAPPIAARPRVPGREFAEVVEEIMEYPRDHYPVEPLDAADKDVPPDVGFSPELERQWLETAHARAGVNCSACHQQRDEQGELGPWNDHPGAEGCTACHGLEVRRFQQGKHGMRLAAGLAPMTPAQARLPMQPMPIRAPFATNTPVRARPAMQQIAAHEELGCVSCHGAHDFDVTRAAVEGCLQCHADEHSLAYEDSPHHRLWQAEVAGEGKPNSGVSCATCHMPRIDFDVNEWMSRTMVDHNQSANLSPNSKMIRPACIHCHGLGFALDALADETLIRRNFNGEPTVHVRSIDLARADQERYQRELEAARQ